MKYSIFIILLSSVLAFSQQMKPNDALRVAASANDIEGMKQALASGADINSTTFDGKTPLILAAFLGHLESVRFLIAQKAVINHRDSTGETALIYAVVAEPEIASELIKAGADVNVKDNDGRTALMHTTNPDLKKRIKDAGGNEIKWVNPRAHTEIPFMFPSAAPSSPQASLAK